MATTLIARSNERTTTRLRSRPTVGERQGGERQGKGSDDPRLANAVVRALQNTGYGCLTDVRVAAFGTYVVLHGRLPSFFAKQFALATARAVPGVGQICDAIELVRCVPAGQKAAS